MNVFVYGTLLVPKIWELVTDRPDLNFSPAHLPGHSIWRVRNATFPAIKQEAPEYQGDVPGLVFFDVPNAAMQRLDSYEDEFYERVSVTVETAAGPVIAEVYRAPAAEAGHIISEDHWTLEWFEENGLKSFLKNVFDH